MTWQDLQDLLPPQARHLLAACRAMAARSRGDSGEVGIVGLVIIAAGLAAIALIVVAAIKAKTHSWISQIPG